MDITIRTPVQIFINGRFYCTAKEVQVKQNDPKFKKSLIPDNMRLDRSQFTGTVINIKKPSSTAKEKEEIKKSLKIEPYDDFFTRMVAAKGDPNSHIPIE